MGLNLHMGVYKMSEGQRALNEEVNPALQRNLRKYNFPLYSNIVPILIIMFALILSLLAVWSNPENSTMPKRLTALGAYTMALSLVYPAYVFLKSPLAAHIKRTISEFVPCHWSTSIYPVNQ